MRRPRGMSFLILSLGFFLLPVAHAETMPGGDGALDASIVQYVASNEGQPMRVDGAATPEQHPVPQAAEAESSTPWNFVVTPYLWTLGFNGGVTIRGIQADIDASFGDIFDVLDMAFCLRSEAWHGPLGFTLDIIYMNLGEDGGVGPLKVDVDLKMLVVELAATYKFEQVIGEGASGGNRYLTFEPILGVRYAGLKGDLDLDVGPVPGTDASGTQWWIEPYVGFRSTVEITDSLTAGVRADIGGFSIGSRLTWVAALGLDYRFSELISVKLGYKWMDVDYATGSGRNRFAMDGMFQGLWLGLSFNF